MKKYELTTEVKVEFGVTLYRIRALVDIVRHGVKAGDLGGWVEKESNLDQEHDAWVFDDARVCGNAWVFDDAQVSGNAWVFDDARVFDNAQVSGNAQVFGNARVCDDARVFGNAWVFDDAQVSGNAWVSGNARVSGNAQVSGNAWVFDDARVSGNAQVCDDAWVSKTAHVLTVGPIGSRDDTTTFFRAKFSAGFAISVCCGCFRGTVDEFRAKVKQTHGDSKYGKAYQLAADLAETQIEIDKEAL